VAESAPDHAEAKVFLRSCHPCATPQLRRVLRRVPTIDAPWVPVKHFRAGSGNLRKPPPCLSRAVSYSKTTTPPWRGHVRVGLPRPEESEAEVGVESHKMEELPPRDSNGPRVVPASRLILVLANVEGVHRGGFLSRVHNGQAGTASPGSRRSGHPAGEFTKRKMEVEKNLDGRSRFCRRIVAQRRATPLIRKG